MARYIDADMLKANIRVNIMPNVDIDGTVTVENAERYFLNLIDKTSTADVVEVVRCKNCKCCELCYPAKAIGEEALESWYCKIRKKHMRPDDFCSYGEKRT